MPKEVIFGAGGAYETRVGWQVDGAEVQVGTETADGRSLLSVLYGDTECLAQIGTRVRRLALGCQVLDVSAFTITAGAPEPPAETVLQLSNGLMWCQRAGLWLTTGLQRTRTWQEITSQPLLPIETTVLRWGPEDDAAAAPTGAPSELGRQVLDIIESSQTNPGTTGYTGVWAALDRIRINQLIRALRRARDAAFGKDA